MATNTPSSDLLADLCTELRELAARADVWMEALTDEPPKRPTRRQLRERDIALSHFLYQLVEDLAFWCEMVEEMPEDYS